MLSNALKLAAALSALSLPAFAQDIMISDAFARETPPSARVGGAFLTLMNHGASDTIISATSPVASRVELHNHTMENGVMKMREIEGGIPLPRGETVALEPGGMHIMFMDLKHQLKRGSEIPVTLQLESGDTLDISLPVKKIGAMGDKHKKHMKHDHSGH